MKTCTKNFLSSAPRVSCLIFIFSALAISLAVTAQYAFHLEPCPLCLAQRAPYAINIVLGLLALFAAKKSRIKVAAFLVFLCGLLFLVDSGIAFYHNGVEQHWWESFLEGCKVTFSTDNAKTMLEKIEAAAPAHCDQIAWSDPVLHLSMAAWNLVASLIMGIFSLVSSVLIARRANGF